MKDGLGQEVTERTVRRTWRMVCEAHATKLATGPAKPVRKLQPRDLPATWKPVPIVSPAVPSTGAAPANPAEGSKRRMTGAEAVESIRAVMRARNV